jgi:predicted ATPase
MLTRLAVSGFKNLVDVDLSFGPFTCIAGMNGVGKSNLLDAIGFLSALADRTLVDAALSVRGGDVRNLFHRVGELHNDTIGFHAEMIIPATGTDDLGQDAVATGTFVSYSVVLRHRRDETLRNAGSLELVREELRDIAPEAELRHLPFAPSALWRSGAVRIGRRPQHYISTAGEGENRIVTVHDEGMHGRPQHLRAANLPRTALSAANAAESPTATLVKRELQSWRLLQLEPSSLRAPDDFTGPFELASDGAHLPAALYRLANVDGDLANRVSELIDGVRSVSVDRDEKRQSLTLQVEGQDGTVFPARSLSDSTLRFLALAVLALDPEAQGVICLEEPENGIHPERIPAMIRLLRDLTTDTDEAVGPGNSVRQVIVNTHSPAVVMQVPEDSLVLAEPVQLNRGGSFFRALQLRCLAGTWREGVNGMKPASKGQLLGYLNPVALADEVGSSPCAGTHETKRVVDRQDLRQLRIPFDEIAG